MKVSYHPATFGSYRQSGVGDVMVFVCHVTLQDNVIKALYDFMVRSSSRYVTILLNLAIIDPVVGEI